MHFYLPGRSLFCVSFCLSIFSSARPDFTKPLSTLPLLFSLGQQCGSSLVSIIIAQSASLSTRNCQPSINTGRAINAISLSSPLSSSVYLFTSFCPSFSLYFFNLPSSHLATPSHLLPSLCYCFFLLPRTLYFEFLCYLLLSNSPVLELWFTPDQCGDGNKEGIG